MVLINKCDIHLNFSPTSLVSPPLVGESRTIGTSGQDCVQCKLPTFKVVTGTEVAPEHSLVVGGVDGGQLLEDGVVRGGRVVAHRPGSQTPLVA